MRRTLSVLLLLAVTSIAAPADAQRRSAVVEHSAVAGVTADQYQSALESAAREAGADALSSNEALERFNAADTDSNGALNAEEVAAAQGHGAVCEHRGVCRYGQCFCVASEGLIEE
ncbi:MAG: putative secreted protein [Bradymonadia bacterium]|jgi:predicted secreted protein